MPTEQQIQEAIDYVLRRVQAEQNIVSRLDRRVVEAAGEIISLAMKYDIPPSMFRFSRNAALKRKVEEIISRLKEELSLQVAEYAGIPEKTDEDGMWAIINRKRNGKTFAQRLDIYSGRLEFEIEAFIAAGLLRSLSRNEIVQAYERHHKRPYDFIQGNGSAVRLQGVSYGVGKSNVAYNALSTLLRSTVADAWMMADMKEAEKKGATGFHSYRGSSYPCSLCDSMTGYHPLSDFPGIWHPNCKCFFVFV